VVIDLDFLDTLQEKQISSGLAEVIKYSIISDRALFDYLEDNMQNIRDLDKKCLEKVVSDCVAIKARTVAEDEYDVKDVRIILNFGHTLGHAVETASEYSGQYDHGEAVGIGMVMASDIAVKMGILEEKHSERIRCLIRKAGLPLSVKNVDPEDVLRIFQYDKKFVSGSMRFVLPERIGKVRVTDNVPFDLIERTVREYVS
jgi:3-dehydroquinate synthase